MTAAGKLLPIFNKLQDALVTVNGTHAKVPKLPQIVVVGSQSSGKSSVLESFVGRDFLPRGAGLVTRRPLVLQLVHTEVTDGPTEWGEFLHAPGQRFADFDAIKVEIEAETDRKLGKSKSISAEPIRLAIYSPHVVDLSLVDLPGMTKVPIAGQPADIEQQLREMALTYIEPAEALILAVSAATSDLATSDAIQLARYADPDGLRTIGVITKLDLMDAGTDALDVLEGRVIPLRWHSLTSHACAVTWLLAPRQSHARSTLVPRRGFIGVVNRSQQDLVDGKTPAAARDEERGFFSMHHRYRALASKMGSGYLARRLNELLLAHIRQTLPALQQEVSGALSRARAELGDFGDSRLEGRNNQGALLLQMIHKFCSTYTEALDGTSVQVQEASRESGELLGGAKINHIFRAQLQESLQAVDACSGLADADISRAIRQATGTRTPLFVPEGSFEILARQQIKLLRPHCLHAVELVLDEMKRLLPTCLPSSAARYAALQSRMQMCAAAALSRRAKQASEMVGSLVAIELAYLNTSHPDFVGGSTAMRHVASQLHAAADEQQSREEQREQRTEPQPLRMPSVGYPGGGGGSSDYGSSDYLSSFNPFASGGPPPPPPPPPPLGGGYAVGGGGGDGRFGGGGIGSSGGGGGGGNSREQLETDIIRSLLVSYYGIVRKNLLDSVPKAIMHFLVNSTRANLEEELVIELYRHEQFGELLREADDAVQRREDCTALVSALERAQRVVDELRTMPIDVNL